MILVFYTRTCWVGTVRTTFIPDFEWVAHIYLQVYMQRVEPVRSGRSFLLPLGLFWIGTELRALPALRSPTYCGRLNTCTCKRTYHTCIKIYYKFHYHTRNSFTSSMSGTSLRLYFVRPRLQGVPFFRFCITSFSFASPFACRGATRLAGAPHLKLSSAPCRRFTFYVYRYNQI